jgi:hypothetical protein
MEDQLLSKPLFRSYAFHKSSPQMERLSNLYREIDENPSSPGWSVVSRSIKKDLLITIRRIGEMRDYPLELIDIDEIVGSAFENELFDYVLARGILRKCAVRYRSMKDRLLAFAYACGWAGNAEYALLRSWDQVRTALKGGYGGCSGIVEFAIRLGKSPDQLSREDIERWMQDMLNKKRSYGTLILTERCFRLQLRRAGLQGLFQFNLGSRNPSEYRLAFDEMTEDLRVEILAIIEWKTAGRRIRGRSAKFKIREITARRLREVLTQVCGYAKHIHGIEDAKSLLEVFQKEILCGFADWLLIERKCKPHSVRTMFHALRALTWQHPLFQGEDYSWLSRKIRQLPHEPQAARKQRQIDKMIHFELLTQLPELIRAERLGATDLSPLRLARLVRDEVFASLPLYWRQIQLRTLDLDENLKSGVLARDVKRQIYLPRNVESALRRAPSSKVTYVHYDETRTKNKEERFEAIQPIPILQEYIEVHRPLLVDSKTHTVLLVNDAGEPMCKQNVIAKLEMLSVRHLGVRVVPHARRRIAATYALGCGETLESVRNMLGQADPTVTWHYADAASPSNRVVALERLYNTPHATL